MKITGMLAIGNGKKCPFCNEILDDRIKGREIISHLERYHEKEMLKKLFKNKSDK